MNVSFYLAATVMTISALLLIIKPLIQEAFQKKLSRGLLAIVVGTVVWVPVATIYLYRLVGTPAALADPLSRNDQRQQDIQTWMNLAHTYDTQQRNNDAYDAYDHVLKIDAANTVAMVGLVEAAMAQHADYLIDEPSRQWLEKALALEPNNQRALWLLGISNFQQKDYAQAARTWRKLQACISPGSPLAQSVAEKIAVADAKATANAAPRVFP